MTYIFPQWKFISEFYADYGQRIYRSHGGNVAGNIHPRRSVNGLAFMELEIFAVGACIGSPYVTEVL